MAEPKYIIATIQNGQRFDDGYRYCVLGPFGSEGVVGFYKERREAEAVADARNRGPEGSDTSPRGRG